jgi:hypothetical protein
MQIHIIRTKGLLALCLILLSACSLLNPLEKDTKEWLDWDGRGGWGESSGGGELFAMEDSSLALAAPADAPAKDEAGSHVTGDIAYQSAALRAGSVDDNAQWDDYLLYRLQFQEWGIPVHELDVSGRHTIIVVNQSARPVLGAVVKVFDPSGEQLFMATTGADGTIYYFPHQSSNPEAETLQIVAAKDGEESSVTTSAKEFDHQLVLDVPSSSDPIHLDIHFLIDATGSMSDEIQQLKDNMIRVAERIASMQANPDVRYGMTIYRDRGDLFISRSFDFTPDVSSFTEALREVQAEGGGDYPESLNEGLHQAIHLPEWRGEETVSLLFLIADAPPHLDYAQDYDYAVDVFSALEDGIKIFPLASSGLDDQGEYIFRQLAQITGGKFLFLTYGPGGAPGDDTSHHVDDYSVLSLDDLVVRLVEEQLAFLDNPMQ